MEKQVQGSVQRGHGGISVEKWVEIYFSEDSMGGEELIETSEGEKIPTREAVLVFKPERKRGENGVCLKEFKGIRNGKKLFIDMLTKGSDEPLCCFPLGKPLNKKGLYLIKMCSSFMIGKYWKQFGCVSAEEKWAVCGIFNVFQFLFFNSTSDPENREKYLGFMRKLWTDTAPKLFETQSSLKMLRSQTSWLKTDDVLHTIISIGLSLKLKIHKQSLAEKKTSAEQICIQALQRTLKYSKVSLEGEIPLGLLCLLYHGPHFMDFMNSDINFEELQEKIIEQEQNFNAEKTKTFEALLTHSAYFPTLGQQGVQTILYELKSTMTFKQKSLLDQNFSVQKELEFKKPQKMKEDDRQPQLPAKKEEIKFFSDQIHINESENCKISCQFPVKLAQVFLAKHGTYEITLKTLEGTSFARMQKDFIDNLKTAQCRFSFGEFRKGKHLVGKGSDTFSINGSSYNASQNSFKQLSSFVKPEDEEVKVKVVFSDQGLRIISEENDLVKVIKTEKQFPFFVLWAQNVEAEVSFRKSEESDYVEEKIQEMELLCSICLEETTLEQATETHCGHTYHVKCFQKWTAEHETCPLCRSILQ